MSTARFEKQLVIDLCEQMRSFLLKWKVKTDLIKERSVQEMVAANKRRWGWLPWYNAEATEYSIRCEWDWFTASGDWVDWSTRTALWEKYTARLASIQLLAEFTVDDYISLTASDLKFLNKGTP